MSPLEERIFKFGVIQVYFQLMFKSDLKTIPGNFEKSLKFEPLMSAGSLIDTSIWCTIDECAVLTLMVTIAKLFDVQ